MKSWLFLALLGWLASSLANEVTLVEARSIHTLDPSRPAAEALAYDATGALVAVGAASDLARRHPDARRLDLGNATVVPGLIDAHGHLLSLGLSLMRVDLVGTRSKGEIIERLRTFASDLPPESWLLGRGWDQNDWPEAAFPTRADLDEHFPDRPVWLIRIDGHAGWANGAAMAAADRDFERLPQPEGGQIHRKATGEATGVFIDTAMKPIAAAVPKTSEAERHEALERALRKAASVGLTGVHDAGTSLADYRLLQAFERDGRLSLRVYAMADGDGAALRKLCAEGPLGDLGGRLFMGSVKFYIDGALGSRGAALLEPYSDDPGNIGLLRMDPQRLARQAAGAMACGLQVNIHAIGDGGTRVALDALEAGMAAHPDHVGRHRVEHAQVIAPADFERFTRHSIIASMQPTHATSDMYWAEDRIGPRRIRGAYAWKALLDAGVRLPLGSDFPVEKPDPLLGLYAAVARRDESGWPEGGWYPDQALTPAQSLAGFTREAAFAAFSEQRVGMLREGMRADFVVLSGDPLAERVDDWLEFKVLATVVDGEPVHQAAGFTALEP